MSSSVTTAVYEPEELAHRRMLAVGIDVGSARTRCMVLAVEGSELCFLGCGETDSDGWHKGRVNDHGRVSEAIRRATQAAEVSSRCAIESAVVGVAGPTVWGEDSSYPFTYPRPREVSPDEMRDAVRMASEVTLEPDRMILHICPQYFALDGRPGYRDPRGRPCRRMDANVHLVTTSTQETHSIVTAMHQASLKVEETVLEPLAAAYASLLQEDRSRGVALVDIGLESTDLVIYNGDALMHSASLPISSDHLTRDVVYGLRISYEDAEALKTQYGCAILGLTSDSSSIVVPSLEGRQARDLPRRELNRILDARAEELFRHVADEIREVEMQGQLAEGVVLTGAAAEMTGMLDMAERVLDCHARKGLILGIKDLPAGYNVPEWTTAAGLAMYSARLKVLKNPKPKAPGPWNLIH